MAHHRSPPLRRERLRDALPRSIDMLSQSRRDEIPAGFLADYVALRWVEQRGGRWRVTAAGGHICQQVLDRGCPHGGAS